MTLVEAILAGDRFVISRALSQVENGSPEGREALNALFPYTGKAHLIGVTGAPGTGKSSLVNRLARSFRQPVFGETPLRVAIVAVDPSSPFTGGAILGDRVRMRDLAGDPGVFIRSMASRGSLGGLASATTGLVQVFDAAGFEVILIETVGAGQGEVDIARLAHTTLVVEAPGFGDEIQAIKAGILEIADILVVNKADLPGAENTERALQSMLELGKSNRSVAPAWTPPILRTVATEGAGIPELVKAIARHKDFLRQGDGWEKREQARLQAEVESILRETLVSRWREQITTLHYRAVLQQLMEHRISPYQAVAELLDGH